MNNIGLITKILLSFIFLSLLPLTVFAQHSKKSLLIAWERQQNNNPHTAVFKKLDERRYKFQIDYFPFYGELKIIKFILDDNNDITRETIAGYVDVELVGFDKYAVSPYVYNAWNMNNVFFYEPQTGKWQSSLRQYKDTRYQGNLDKKELDKQLRNIWKLMNECLRKGDIEGALKFIHPSKRNKYEKIFEVLKPQLPHMVAKRIQFNLIELGDDGVARYEKVCKDGESFHSDDVTFTVFSGHWWIVDP
jgi:hypothetical protein